jgi:hypothetical protein
VQTSHVLRWKDTGQIVAAVWGRRRLITAIDYLHGPIGAMGLQVAAPSDTGEGPWRLGAMSMEARAAREVRAPADSKNQSDEHLPPGTRVREDRGADSGCVGGKARWTAKPLK